MHFSQLLKTFNALLHRAQHREIHCPVHPETERWNQNQKFWFQFRKKNPEILVPSAFPPIHAANRFKFFAYSPILRLFFSYPMTLVDRRRPFLAYPPMLSNR